MDILLSIKNIVLSNMEVTTPATIAEAFVELKARKVISDETAKNMINKCIHPSGERIETHNI